MATTAVVALVLLAVGGLITWNVIRSTVALPGQVTRMSIVFPEAHVRMVNESREFAVSPSGSHVVYEANRELYLRALDRFDAQLVPGTEGTDPTSPFFSPDGQWIGFYSYRDDALQKIPVSGGTPVTLFEGQSAMSPNWGPDDQIIFGREGAGILRIAGAGGSAELLVPVDLPELVTQPQILPGGEAVLYTLGTWARAWDTAQIIVERLATGERTVVLDGGSAGRYVPTGHLVYALGESLLAVPFDVTRLEVTGGAVPLLEGIFRSMNNDTGSADFDLSRTGAIVYRPTEARLASNTLVWVDRSGEEEVVPVPPHIYIYPRLAPDGRRMTLDTRGAGDDDVWVWDLDRETFTRLTVSPQADQYGVWTPDGKRVVFSSTREGVPNLYWRPADGTGLVERLAPSPNDQYPHAVSPDGKHLVYREHGPTTGRDLYVLPLDDARQPRPLVVTEFTELNAEFSPDGRWLAYQSDASGDFEIYVRPFPSMDTARWQISTAGGTQPLWSPAGRELFFRTEAGVMGVPVQTGGTDFSAGRPTLIVQGDYRTPSSAAGRTYDVTSDGERFLLIRANAGHDPNDPFAGATRLHVVLNWLEELRARVPTS